MRLVAGYTSRTGAWPDHNRLHHHQLDPLCHHRLETAGVAALDGIDAAVEQAEVDEVRPRKEAVAEVRSERRLGAAAPLLALMLAELVVVREPVRPPRLSVSGDHELKRSIDYRHLNCF